MQTTLKDDPYGLALPALHSSSMSASRLMNVLRQRKALVLAALSFIGFLLITSTGHVSHAATSFRLRTTHDVANRTLGVSWQAGKRDIT